MGREKLPEIDNRAYDQAHNGKDGSTLAADVWGLAESILRGTKRGEGKPESESGPLDLNTDIYARKEDLSASYGGSVDADAGGNYQALEVEVGPAIIESPPRIVVEVGPAVIESPTREFVFDSDGSTVYEIVRGDTLTGIARDLLHAQHAGEPDYRPSGRELNRTVREIARQNHIGDPDEIRAGRTLEIRPPFQGVDPLARN